MPWSLDVWNHGLFYWWHPISFCNLKPSEKGTNYITMATSMLVFNMSAPFNTELPPRAYLKHQRKAQKFFNFISKFSAIKTLPSTKPGVFLPRQKPWENVGILGLLPQQKTPCFSAAFTRGKPSSAGVSFDLKGSSTTSEGVERCWRIKVTGTWSPWWLVVYGCIGWLYWLVGLLDVTKCWLSIWGCVKLVGYDDTMRPFKFAFETWLVLCHCIACYKST